MTRSAVSSTVRLGSGTGCSRDRLDLVTRGDLDCLCFDSMSEVSLAENPGTPAYDPYLMTRMRPLLAKSKARGVRIVTNQGWLVPVGDDRTCRGSESQTRGRSPRRERAGGNGEADDSLFWWEGLADRWAQLVSHRASTSPAR
ncbi:acyclic terpene utilization AtuA family protein [Streptomyces sp. NPDC001312]|uniref:acyclic terpene utilization AtuA family protein n=1 Tax=Streptomyces sp. NPDC001312 TaxID=3364561 RepID=UPI0036C6450A